MSHKIDLHLIHAILVMMFNCSISILKGVADIKRFNLQYKAHELKNKLPGCNTTRIKKCPLTKNCGCWVYSQIIFCCTGVVGMHRLHFRNIQVLFITRKISYITRTPGNCRRWVSFHFTFKWCILFTADKDFRCKYNLRRNCNELKTTTTIKQKVMNGNN